jgi:Uma2 family endonuclease
MAMAPFHRSKNGDHLTRDEFERRFDAMPDLKKAELIEGVVYLPLPVRQRRQGELCSTLIGWLFMYNARTPELELGASSSIRLDLGNMPQPDGTLFIQREHGGQATIDDDDYIHGTPELVAEVGASTVSHDRNQKLEVYERNGVREYLLVRVLDREVDWYARRNQTFQKLMPESDGIIKSTVFPGLWLDPVALFSSANLERLLAVLERGLQSPEHAEFVNRLRRINPSSGTRPIEHD